jgi:hypothetical protein
MNKENKLLVLALLTLILTASAFFATYNQYQLNASAPSILYYFDDAQNRLGLISSEETNTLSATISCHNIGKSDGAFQLIVTFVNATYSGNNETPCTVINSTCASLPWTLHSGDHSSRILFYHLDKNVSGFSITLSIQKESNPMKTAELYPCVLQYTYNATLGFFELNK